MNLKTLKLERSILSSKKFQRLQQISLVVDHMRVRDTAQTRASHSIEVANSIEIMNYVISKQVGFNIDRYNCGRIVGLLHDIGHTAFSHEGEIVLNKLIKTKSKKRLSFEGNANNYITIQKNCLLDHVEKDIKHYILASLAKHIEELYEEQGSLKKIIKKELKKEVEFLNKNGLNVSTLNKTIQCQIMDIADENSYIISDIIDSLNIFSKNELADILRKELSFKVSDKLIRSLYKGQNHFRRTMQTFHDKFCENFQLNEVGEIIPIDKELEEIRLNMAKISKKYILTNKIVLISRNEIRKKLHKVFEYYLDFKNAHKIPSKYYRTEFFKASSKIEKLKIIRNMLGSLTNKGLLKEYKKIL